MEPLLLSLLPYAVPTVGIVGCVILFFTLKGELRAGDRKVLASCEALDSAWKARFDELEKKYKEIAGQAAPFNPPVPARAIDLARRSQALQLYRQGEPPDRIAAALGIPRNEVELLLKVNALLLRSAAGA